MATENVFVIKFYSQIKHCAIGPRRKKKKSPRLSWTWNNRTFFHGQSVTVLNCINNRLQSTYKHLCYLIKNDQVRKTLDDLALLKQGSVLVLGLQC